MKEYEVWMEGAVTNGEIVCPSYYGKITAESFKDACKKVVAENGDGELYDEERNTVWGMKFYDNKEDALRLTKGHTNEYYDDTTKQRVLMR